MGMISRFRNRTAASRKRTARDLAHALRTAPTRASREEILLLQNR